MNGRGWPTVRPTTISSSATCAIPVTRLGSFRIGIISWSLREFRDYRIKRISSYLPVSALVLGRISDIIKAKAGNIISYPAGYRICGQIFDRTLILPAGYRIIYWSITFCFQRLYLRRLERMTQNIMYDAYCRKCKIKIFSCESLQ